MAYFQGNAALFTLNFKLPQAEASKYAGKWIAVPSSNKLYSQLATYLTVSSVMTGATPAAPLTFTKRTIIDGKSVVGVSGGLGPYATGASGRQVLYISTVAPYLPVAITGHGSTSAGLTLTFTDHLSDYGKPVSVTAPANSIPISSVPGMP